MHLTPSLLLALATLATTTFAGPVPHNFVVAADDEHRHGGFPPGTPDGFYTGVVNSADNSTHWTLIPDLNITIPTATIVPSGPALTKRDGVTCEYKLANTYSVADATTQLSNACGNGYSYSHTVAKISGGAIAYGCDYGNGQTCYFGDVNGFFNSIRGSCGTSGSNDRSGWYSKSSWKATYGWTTTGNGVC